MSVKKHAASAMIAFVALASCLQAGCRAQQPWPLWQAYTQHFIDGQGRVIDRSAGDRTTSEGQAYAMFFALTANDRATFDKLLTWTEGNLAGGDMTLRLPAWSWGKNDAGEWKTVDENPASDADVWMAYSLMEAGRLWHEPRYESLGKVMAARIARQEVATVAGIGPVIVPGPQGFHPEPTTWIVNPSYMPLPVLVYFAKNLPDGPWNSILAALPKLMEQGAGKGFAMDWISASPDGVKPVAAPAEPTAGTKEAQVVGSYDAIRVYLWLGIADARTPGAKELVKQLWGMTEYMKTGATPPLEVDATGKVLRVDSPPGFSAAVAPFLAAAGLKTQAEAQMVRVAATRDSATGLYGQAGAYYDQNLALFSTGFIEQRYLFERDGRLRLKWK